MRLTRYTDYSLRVLIFLALQKGERLVTIAEIAEHFDISRNHLIKIVHRLGQLGYAGTVRGKGGGIRLGAPPASIGIGRVIRSVEANLNVVECERPRCPLLPMCRLKGLLGEARDAFLEVLDRYTLQDLIEQPREMREVLHWDPAPSVARRRSPPLRRSD